MAAATGGPPSPLAQSRAVSQNLQQSTQGINDVSAAKTQEQLAQALSDQMKEYMSHVTKLVGQ